MRAFVAALALTVSGCSYHSPTAPTTSAPPIAANEPFSLTLGSSVGSGTTADHATITAKVQGPNGQPLARILVTFSTTVGTLDPEQMATNSNGISSTTLVASTAAVVTVKAGSLSARTGVGTQPAAQPPPAPTPTPAPTPGPNPGPTPTGPLTITVTAADVIVGSTTILSASIQNGVPPYQLTWAFGDGTTFNGSSTTSAHLYGAAGKYAVSVTVTDAAARTTAATVTVNVLAAPPPPTPIRF